MSPNGPHLSAVLDCANLDRHVAEGTVARKVGPDGFVLFNYTQKAQWSQAWDAESLACRGLVVDLDGFVQSRPFGKFFNIGEHASPNLADLPVEPFEVFEKLDGSLIVASTTDDGVLMTTRGSFDSEQAIEAKRLWERDFGTVEIPRGETWCFEFIAPWNRIVVDYGERTALILLAQIDNVTGQDMPLRGWDGPTAHAFDGLTDFDAITEAMAGLTADEEGFVLRFESGFRAKAKGAEYLRLHKLLTGVSAKTIWECLANGTDLASMLDRVPDEFYAWVTATADELNVKYDEVLKAARARLAEIEHLPSRKHQAIAIADFEHKSVVFGLLDDKVVADRIWRTLKPDATRPFVMDGLA